jgi:hypothetical protein
MATIPSAAQKGYFLTILLPMWRGQLDQTLTAQREFRLHLLAVECLRVAKGPGVDPLRIAEFCRNWKIPLTAPFVGPVAVLRKIGKAVGGSSLAAAFDPTGAINTGVKVIAQMGPLLGSIQMRNAVLVAFDDKVVEAGDQFAVGSILESCHSPQILMSRVQESKNKLERVWKDTSNLAEKMEPIRKELGLPETIL